MAYLRDPAFNKDTNELTDQANHIAATLGADIAKQKMAENNGGYHAVKFG